MPSRWEVTLTGSADSGIPLTAPHAVVSGWLDDRTGSQVSRSGHGDQVKKWAFGPLRVPADGRETTVLQVRLLDDSLADRLLIGTQPGTEVRLGGGRYRVCEPTRLVEHVSWVDLRKLSGALAWQVRFATPACVRRRNRTSPLLTPEAFSLGLAERWRLLDPATVPTPPWRPGTCPAWVSDLDGHTEAQILPRTIRSQGRSERREEVVSGFVGRVRYVCDQGNDAEADTFGALLAFAAFAGAGSHTAYGFGVTIPEPTWQPPTTRVGRQLPDCARAFDHTARNSTSCSLERHYTALGFPLSRDSGPIFRLSVAWKYLVGKVAGNWLLLTRFGTLRLIRFPGDGG